MYSLPEDEALKYIKDNGTIKRANFEGFSKNEDGISWY